MNSNHVRSIPPFSNHLHSNFVPGNELGCGLHVLPVDVLAIGHVSAQFFSLINDLKGDVLHEVVQEVDAILARSRAWVLFLAHSEDVLGHVDVRFLDHAIFLTGLRPVVLWLGIFFV